MIINNTCQKDLQCYSNLSENSMGEFVISTKYFGESKKKRSEMIRNVYTLGNNNIYLFSLQVLQLVQQLYLFFLLLLRN